MLCYTFAVVSLYATGSLTVLGAMRFRRMTLFVLLAATTGRTGAISTAGRLLAIAMAHRFEMPTTPASHDRTGIQKGEGHHGPDGGYPPPVFSTSSFRNAEHE